MVYTSLPQQSSVSLKYDIGFASVPQHPTGLPLASFGNIILKQHCSDIKLYGLPPQNPVVLLADGVGGSGVDVGVGLLLGIGVDVGVGVLLLLGAGVGVLDGELLGAGVCVGVGELVGVGVKHSVAFVLYSMSSVIPQLPS